MDARRGLTILRLHKKLGTRWAEIAKSLPGRFDNGVKNRYSTCSRMLRQQVAEEEAAAEAAAGGGAAAAAPAAAPAPAAAAAASPAAPARAPPPPLRVGSEDGVGRAMTPLANALGGARMNDTADKARGDDGGADGGRETSKMRGFGDGAAACAAAARSAWAAPRAPPPQEAD